MGGGQDWGARRAAQYDRRVRELFPAYDELHARALALLRQRVVAGAEILVIGAGTGAETIGLAGAGFRVTALDPSGAMLDIGRAREGVGGIQFVEGTMDALPEAPRFAAAVSLLVMHFLRDDGAKERYLRQAAARCVAGATLVLADLVGEPGTRAFERQFIEWLLPLAENSTPAELERDPAKLLKDVHFVMESRVGELLSICGWEHEGPIWSSGWLSMWCPHLTGESRPGGSAACGGT